MRKQTSSHTMTRTFCHADESGNYSVSNEEHFFFKTRKKARKGNTEKDEFEVTEFVKIVEGI